MGRISCEFDITPDYRSSERGLEQGILTKVNLTTVRFGLEVRPPLRDHRMVALAARLPDSLKNEGGVQKAMLRRLLEARLPQL